MRFQRRRGGIHGILVERFTFCCLAFLSCICVGAASPLLAPSEEQCRARVGEWAQAELNGMPALGAEGHTRLQPLLPLLAFLRLPQVRGHNLQECLYKPLFRPADRCKHDSLHPAEEVTSERCSYTVVQDRGGTNATGPPVKWPASITTVLQDPYARAEALYLRATEVAVAAADAEAGKREELEDAEGKRHAGAAALLGRGPMLADIMKRRALVGSPTAPAWRSNFTMGMCDRYFMPFEEFVRTFPDDMKALKSSSTIELALLGTGPATEPAALRSCLTQFPDQLGSFALDVAKARLERMLHVNMGELPEDSIQLFEAILKRSESLSSKGDDWRRGLRAKLAAEGGAPRLLTEEGLGFLSQYQKCRRHHDARRMARSRRLMADTAQLFFNCTVRRRADERAKRRLFEELNGLDMELHSFGRLLFHRRQKHFLLPGLLEQPPAPEADNALTPLLRARVPELALSGQQQRQAVIELPGGRRAVMEVEHTRGLLSAGELRAGSAFIISSAYRSGNRTFTAVGMRSASQPWLAKAASKGCLWRGKDGAQIAGSLSENIPGDNNGFAFETRVLHCKLERDPLLGPGDIVAHIEAEEFVFLSNQAAAYEEPPPPAYFLTHCSAKASHGDLKVERIREWLEYHRVLVGVERFLIYDAGALVESAAAMAMLQPYVDRGVVDLMDVRSIAKYAFRSKGQVLHMHECIHRTRRTTQWLLFSDFDEYLVATPPATVPSLLAKHAGLAWLTLGSFYWDQTCTSRNDPRLWQVERYLHRAELPVGANFTRTGSPGRRKCIVNPRKVHTVRVHKVIGYKGEGVELDTRTAHLAHYRGLMMAHSWDARDHASDDVLAQASLCASWQSDYVKEMDHVWSDEVARTIPAVRRCPLGIRQTFELTGGMEHESCRAQPPHHSSRLKV